jgi:hypothetical protein
MGVQSTIAHFAGEVQRVRPLTPAESDMLGRALSRGKSTRTFWTAADDRLLTRYLRRRMTAVQIGEAMGRTAWAVRSRVRALKRRAGCA